MCVMCAMCCVCVWVSPGVLWLLVGVMCWKFMGLWKKPGIIFLSKFIYYCYCVFSAFIPTCIVINLLPVFFPELMKRYASVRRMRLSTEIRCCQYLLTLSSKWRQVAPVSRIFHYVDMNSCVSVDVVRHVSDQDFLKTDNKSLRTCYQLEVAFI